MMKMKFAQNAIIPGFFYYIFTINISFLCEGDNLETNCIVCNIIGTNRDDDHTNGKCPCKTGYFDEGNEICA